jgi:hypothetical protein
VSNAETLLSSSAAAAGAAVAALADLVKLTVATDPTATTAIRATARRRVIAAWQRALQVSSHIFIFVSPHGIELFATNNLVVILKKICCH